MMKYIQLFAFLILYSFAMPVHASDKDSEKYQDFLSIPHVLREQAKSGVHLEDYLKKVFQTMRYNGVDKISLRIEDTQQILEREIAKIQKHRAAQFVKFDINVDGKIDRNEVFHALKETNSRIMSQRQAMKSSEAKSLMLLDNDGDYIVTYREMMAISKRERLRLYDSNATMRTIRALLLLDPNKDKVLTARELKALALKAFTTIDKDGNATISYNEWSEVARATTLSQPVSKIGALTECFFQDMLFPKGLKVYGTGATHGRKLDFAVDQSGYKASEVDVVVNQPKKPVALILAGAKPMIWNIQHTEKTEIHAVFVTGQHQQFVIGLDKNVPVINSSGQDKVCGVPYFDHKKLMRLNNISNQLFKKDADVFYRINSDTGQVVLGNPTYDPKRLIRHDKLTAQDLKLKDPAAIGGAISDAIAMGVIRRAKQADIDMVYQVYATVLQNNGKTQNLPKVEGITRERSLKDNIPLHFAFTPERAYVVLKDFSYPMGLNGLFAKAFIISEGVSTPTGNAGSSAVFDMNTKQCISNDHPNGRCLKIH